MNFKRILLPTAAAASLLFSTETNAENREILDVQKMELTLQNQEKGLMGAQQEAWDFFKETDDYKNIFPALKARLQLSKISANARMIYVPGDDFTVMVYKQGKTVRVHTPHIKPEIFIPVYEADKKYEAAANAYVVRPNGKKDADADSKMIDLVYKKINEKIHHLVTFTKPDTKNNPYQFNLTGSFIEIPALYMKPLNKEEQSKIGLTESEEETKINDVLGRALSKEQILALNGTQAYCQFWFSPLSHYSVGKRAHDFFSVAQIAPLTKEGKTAVQTAINDTFARTWEHEFSALPKKIKQLPFYKENAAELDTLLTQLNTLHETMKQANAYKAADKSLAHTGALDKWVGANLRKVRQTGAKPQPRKAQEQTPKTAAAQSGALLNGQIGPDAELIPVYQTPKTAPKDMQNYMALPIGEMPLRTKSILANVQQSLTDIMTLLYTYQMPQLDEQALKNGAYAGRVIELPVLMHNKNGRISLQEMRAAGKVDNPIILGINDKMGRAWTFKEVVNQNPKAYSVQKLSNVLAKCRLKDQDYSFLMIYKDGPLTDFEAGETNYLIKVQIRAMMEKTLADAQKNAIKLPIYGDETGKSHIDGWVQKINAFESAVRQHSLLFDSNAQMPKALANEEILNNINKAASVAKHKAPARAKGARTNDGNTKE